MLNIIKLFGRSPFAPLQQHMDKVAEAVEPLRSLFDALRDQDYDRVQAISRQISEAEHSADLIKNDIRNHLPKSLFLSLDRSALLEILSLQDSIADSAEDCAVLVALRQITLTPDLQALFPEFLDKHLAVFTMVRQVMMELDELLETSFGGIEAEKVRSLVQEVAQREHEADVVQRTVLRALLQEDNGMHYTTFYLWQKILLSLSNLANISEKLAHRMRMTLEL